MHREPHEDATPGPIRPSSPPSAVPSIGSSLADGRYEITELLGEGGMSTVLGAFDHQIRRPVALKILRASDGARALLDEARMLGAAHASDVVAVYALHLDARPPFLVMERVHGVALDDLLRKTTLSFVEGRALLARIAHALDGLHARGIAHGDVKASNVLVSDDGSVKLADLGITPMLGRTSAGDVLGTPSYMPPERARGLTLATEQHLRGDVYSFAVLAHVVLFGRLPFEADGPHGYLRAHVCDPPPRPSELVGVAASFDAPFAAGLAKDPMARPATAGELVRRIERASRGTGPDGRSASILVVDDDDAHRQLHERVLAHELPGARLATAPDAAAALELVLGEVPDVAVLDLAMPRTSGLELLGTLRRIAPETRAVVVTGQGSGKERERAAELGVRHFLVKPVDAAELVRCVDECIRSRARTARELDAPS